LARVRLDMHGNSGLILRSGPCAITAVLYAIGCPRWKDGDVLARRSEALRLLRDGTDTRDAAAGGAG
jgi:hypothetical protein